MRKTVLAAAGLAFLAAASWSAAPAQAMPLSAATALKGASDGIKLTEAVGCWDECGYYAPRRHYYRSYYRPHYRPHYRPYYRSYYRPYYETYYRPYVPPPWVSGPYYSRPHYYYVGPNIYSY